MHYFNPLYRQKYEITRTGTGLNTKYNFQSIGDSGITEEQYAELVAKCNEVCESYVRPIDKYEEVKARSEAAQNEAVQVDNQQGGNASQNAWGQNQAPASQPQQGWGAPQQQGWGQNPQNQNTQQQGWGQNNQQAPQQGWNQAPQQNNQQQGWGQNPQQNPQQQAPTQQGWGQAAPQGAWTQNPQN